MQRFPLAIVDAVSTLAQGYYENEQWFSGATCSLRTGEGISTIRLLRAIQRAEDDYVRDVVAGYFGDVAYRDAVQAVRGVERYALKAFI